MTYNTEYGYINTSVIYCVRFFSSWSPQRRVSISVGCRDCSVSLSRLVFSSRLMLNLVHQALNEALMVIIFKQNIFYIFSIQSEITWLRLAIYQSPAEIQPLLAEDIVASHPLLMKTAVLCGECVEKLEILQKHLY